MNQPSLTPSKRLLELFPTLLTPPAQGEDYFFLRFKLFESQLGLISMEAVKETILVEADSITPIPNMPQACLGLISSRDEVFPVIDLPFALGNPEPSRSTRKYQIIVIDIQPHLVESKLIGLIVPQVQGVNKFKAVEVSELPPGSNLNLTTAVDGVLTLHNERLWVLNVSKLNQLPSLQQ